MAVVDCPVCGSKVNAEAGHCPLCGADPRLDAQAAQSNLRVRFGSDAFTTSAPVLPDTGPQWHWRTGHIVALLTPLVVASALAAVVIAAALGFAMAFRDATDYTAGLSALVFGFIVVTCGVQLLSYTDGAVAILRGKTQRVVWLRIGAEVMVAGFLFMVIIGPLIFVSPAGWLFFAFPAVGVYLVVVGFSLMRGGRPGAPFGPANLPVGRL